MKKQYMWLAVFGVLIVIFGLNFWPNKTPDNFNFVAGEINPLDNIKGNPEAKVVLIEYSDFECPACRAYYPIIRELAVEFGDRVAFVYRHFPLSSIHQNAEFASRAAEASGKQGKFWEMHDLLFQKQQEWAKVANVMPLFESYAALLGLNIEQFKQDFTSAEVKNFVRAQKNHSIRLGLQGTPSFFVNGEQIKNPSSIEEFRKILNEALKQNTQI